MAIYRNLELKGEKDPAAALRRYSETVNESFPFRTDQDPFGVNEYDCYPFKSLNVMAMALARFGFNEDLVLAAVLHQRDRADLSEKFGLEIDCYSAWLTLGETSEEFSFLAFQQYTNIHERLSVRKISNPICLEELLKPFISREYLNKPPLFPSAHEGILDRGCGGEDLPYKEHSGQRPCEEDL